MLTHVQKSKIEGIENMIICAHWMIDEFERMDLCRISAIYRRALDDRHIIRNLFDNKVILFNLI